MRLATAGRAPRSLAARAAREDQILLSFAKIHPAGRAAGHGAQGVGWRVPQASCGAARPAPGP